MLSFLIWIPKHSYLHPTIKEHNAYVLNLVCTSNISFCIISLQLNEYHALIHAKYGFLTITSILFILSRETKTPASFPHSIEGLRMLALKNSAKLMKHAPRMIGVRCMSDTPSSIVYLQQLIA